MVLMVLIMLMMILIRMMIILKMKRMMRRISTGPGQLSTEGMHMQMSQETGHGTTEF